MPEYVALRVIDMLSQYEITLVSDLDEPHTREIGFEFTQDLKKYITRLTGKGYVIPYAENILPRISDPGPEPHPPKKGG
ncbi:MAG: hypothetical protein HUN05_12630 [Desulfobacter sp.]|nr:MAG: hypothetical protein HUN05_12630 [Desulfobacter sp.]